MGSQAFQVQGAFPVHPALTWPLECVPKVQEKLLASPGIPGKGFRVLDHRHEDLYMSVTLGMLSLCLDLEVAQDLFLSSSPSDYFFLATCNVFLFIAYGWLEFRAAGRLAPWAASHAHSVVPCAQATN